MLSFLERESQCDRINASLVGQFGGRSQDGGQVEADARGHFRTSFIAAQACVQPRQGRARCCLPVVSAWVRDLGRAKKGGVSQVSSRFPARSADARWPRRERETPGAAVRPPRSRPSSERHPRRSGRRFSCRERPSNPGVWPGADRARSDPIRSSSRRRMSARVFSLLGTLPRIGEAGSPGSGERSPAKRRESRSEMKTGTSGSACLRSSRAPV